MTANPSVPVSDQSELAPPASTARLLVWLAAQLVVLIVSVLRLPLAARYPEPAEQLAPHLLLCFQIVIASLTFPWLLRDLRTLAQIVATALPFQLAAAYLAGASARDVSGGVWYADAVLVTLGIWAPLLRSNVGQSVGVALASCVTLGGGMLRYLRVEYSGGALGSVAPGWENVTPLASTLQALESGTPTGGWVLLAVAAAIGITFRLLHRQPTAELGVTR